MNSPKVPRVLVADDDLVSRTFLSAALAELGCEAETAADAASALRIAATAEFDLMLLDCRMPDFGGAELLAALRAAGSTTPAIATSAAVAAQTDSLRAAGFADVLEKPTTVAMLSQTIAGIVNLQDGAPPVLDDNAALGALGNRETMRSLRALLAAEIRELQIGLRKPDTSMQTLASNDRLHRLRASCGFCGAPALAAAAEQLERAIKNDRDAAASGLKRFEQICATTLDALNA